MNNRSQENANKSHILDASWDANKEDVLYKVFKRDITKDIMPVLIIQLRGELKNLEYQRDDVEVELLDTLDVRKIRLFFYESYLKAKEKCPRTRSFKHYSIEKEAWDNLVGDPD